MLVSDFAIITSYSFLTIYEVADIKWNFNLHAPNGWRYPLVGGTRQRRFAGTNSKPRKLLENAQTPTTMAPAYFAGDRVHAVLGGSSMLL
jgi:hypothetical protein